MKKTINYLLLVLAFVFSSCQKDDSFTTRIYLQNNTNSEIELRFFNTDENLRAILNPYQSIILFEQTHFDVSNFGLLQDYPDVYDSLQLIKEGYITKIYYNRNSNDCLIDKNPLCLEQYQKNVIDVDRKTTVTNYIIMIE